VAVRSIAFYRDDSAGGPPPTRGTALPADGRAKTTSTIRRTGMLFSNVARTVMTLVFSYRRQYITVKALQRGGEPTPDFTGDGRTQCFVVDSLAAFEAVAREIGTSFRDSVADLRTRVMNGCVLSVARQPQPDGRLEVVGYEIAERGIFSALGRRTPVADDVIFSHYVEVLPTCRGQRIHRLLFSTRDAYFSQRGGRIVVGVCEPQNHASLRALQRDGAVVVGVVERTSVLRFFVTSYTPFERIAHLLY
jgi:hypothetical protein